MRINDTVMKMNMQCIYRVCTVAIAILALSGCSGGSDGAGLDRAERTPEKGPLFALLSPKETGVTFENTLTEDEDVNFLLCYNCYYGAGVAVGDIDNDGLPDIYFAGNQVGNRLYRNSGDFRFEDITHLAGVSGGAGWSFGVTMADVNGDGYLDIYVCRSQMPFEDDERPNLLFINNGNRTFTEQAAEYGLDDRGYSTQAAFFDYDRDGDLDMYLINHPNDYRIGFTLAEMREMGKNPKFRDKLFRNDGDRFSDVTSSSGIISGFAFGLNVSIGDIDNDGWPDIFVSNDFTERDFLYTNNRDGTFTECLKERIQHISNFSMGSDMADFNNDGYLDLCVVDMVSEDHYRSKTLMSAMRPREFWTMVDSGFYYQYMSNVLQLNNGGIGFSDIGHLAGTARTDWSWSPLFADFDNDGFKDLFVSNGMVRDFQDNDNLRRLRRDLKDYTAKSSRVSERDMPLILNTPSTKVKNYMFRNSGKYTFNKISDEWGLKTLSFSTGAAYADFDADGDLDLVLNNVNDAAFIYRNESEKHSEANFLRVDVADFPSANSKVLGARITIAYDGMRQTQELYVTRGYLSASEAVAHFGLGAIRTVDTVEVAWPDGKYSYYYNVATNEFLTASYKLAGPRKRPAELPSATLFTELDVSQSGIDFLHTENEFDDFLKEILLPHKQSRHGPAIAVGDVNGDGLDDLFSGGAAGSSGRLFLGAENGVFAPSNDGPWKDDLKCEDMGALFFDAESDGDLDLYVVSGGNEFSSESPLLQDRLYLNDGLGNFKTAQDRLPQMRTSGSCVTAADYDNDGDLDLFVGGRIIPGTYPFPARSYILQNVGGKFSDVTESIAPELANAGLVTSALWSDIDNDGALDLIVVGEWMAPGIYRNSEEGFVNIASRSGIDRLTGWWNSLAAGDFDNDGDTDFIAGNVGLNNKYRPTAQKPLQLYCADFDHNNTLDIVLAKFVDDKLAPVRGRECSSEQMPFIKFAFPSYHDFAVSSLEDIYTKEALDSALHYVATTFASMYIRNDGDGVFVAEPLPVEAQFAPVYGIVSRDFDGDGALDAALVGNNFGAEVETVRYDAGIGVYLRGDGSGGFAVRRGHRSGLYVTGDARSLAYMVIGRSQTPALAVGINDSRIKTFAVKAPQPGFIRPEFNDRYALLRYTDGRIRKEELRYGSGYLSQNSRIIEVTSAIESIQLVSASGEKRSIALETLAVND